MRIVVIQGNIGAGKTSLLNEAEKAGWEVFREPVTLWRLALERMYHGGVEEMSDFQTLVFAHYVALTAHLEHIAAEGREAPIVVVERSPRDSLSVFMEHNRSKFDPMVWELLAYNYQRLCARPVWQEATYVYLDTPIEVCQRRVAQRARQGEEDLPIALLEGIDKRYRCLPHLSLSTDQPPAQCFQRLQLQLFGTDP